MQALRARKQLALNTNLLLDLAAGLDFAQEFNEVFQIRGDGFVAPPTILAFSDADLPAAHPVHPKALVRAMR